MRIGCRVALDVSMTSLASIELFGFRLNIDDSCGVNYFSLLRFEMELINDCNEINIGTGYDAETAKAACQAGAKIWQRDSWFFANPNGPPDSTYYAIQIVDGCGNKLDPSYEEWVDYQGTEPTNGYVNAFRSINTKKDAKKDPSCKTGSSRKSSKKKS